jgi:Reverse transcriptase (RNA-dependent DNA polymerase)
MKPMSASEVLKNSTPSYLSKNKFEVYRSRKDSVAENVGSQSQRERANSVKRKASSELNSDSGKGTNQSSLPTVDPVKLVAMDHKMNTIKGICGKLNEEAANLKVDIGLEKVIRIICEFVDVGSSMFEDLVSVCKVEVPVADPAGDKKNRYIQEVLINTLENITIANENRYPGLIVAIDQSRAFDTITLEYMSEVFKFFGMGENFIKLLETIGTNRKACIKWDDGSYSPTFDLKTGRTQGDGPSPLEYNFGEQVLLFRIELDPNIKPLVEIITESANIPDPLPWFRHETGKKQGR